jgi:hypothetical protein
MGFLLEAMSQSEPIGIDQDLGIWQKTDLGHGTSGAHEQIGLPLEHESE